MVKNEKVQICINLVAKILSHGVALLTSFVLTPYLINRIGKEAYSYYPIANNFLNYMLIISTALNSMASRYITIYITRKQDDKTNVYFSSVFFANVILSLVLLIPMVITVLFLDGFLNIPVHLVSTVKILFALVFCSMIIELLANVFGVAAFSKNRLELNSLSEIFIAVLKVVLYIGLFSVFDANVIFVGVVAVCVAVSHWIIKATFTRKLLPQVHISKKYFDISAVKTVIKSGVWNSVNQIGVVLLSTIGLMACNMLYGVSSAADYSVALTVPTSINGLVSMVSSIFLPLITIKYAQSKYDEMINYVHNSQKLIGSTVNVVVVVFIAVGVNFYRLWMPAVDANVVQRYSILASSYLIVTSVSWPVTNLNTVTNKVKVPALVMVSTGILNLMLIWFFAKFTKVGPLSIPATQMVLFILNRLIFVELYAARNINRKWYTFYSPIVKSLISSAVLFVISYFTNKIVNPASWLSLIVECVILGLIGLIINIYFVFGINNVKEVIIRLKNRH